MIPTNCQWIRNIWTWEFWTGRGPGGDDKEDMVRMFFRCTAGLLESQTFQGTTTAIFLPSVFWSTLWTVMRVSTSSSSWALRVDGGLISRSGKFISGRVSQLIICLSVQRLSWFLTVVYIFLRLCSFQMKMWPTRLLCTDQPSRALPPRTGMVCRVTAVELPSEGSVLR